MVPYAAIHVRCVGEPFVTPYPLAYCFLLPNWFIVNILWSLWSRNIHYSNPQLRFNFTCVQQSRLNEQESYQADSLLKCRPFWLLSHAPTYDVVSLALDSTSHYMTCPNLAVEMKIKQLARKIGIWTWGHLPRFQKTYFQMLEKSEFFCRLTYSCSIVYRKFNRK